MAGHIDRMGLKSGDKPPDKLPFSRYFYNWITYVGVFLSIFVFFAEFFLFAIDFFSHQGDLYLGIFTYCLLPPFLILGLLLIPIGALRKKRRVEQGLAGIAPKVLKIDPSIPSHRNAVIVFLVGTFILVLMSAIGAYKAFIYTESVEFCGTMCHQVMAPEHTTYQNSPHSEIKCVNCHIGEGAGWYMRSKISGARQVLRTLTNTYKKPVETPVYTLRPAEDTCLKCHSPKRFFSSADHTRSYFLNDEANTRWDIRMLVKVGGAKGTSEGIHSHMNIDHTIYYAADDKKREKIGWVKSVDRSGKETLYISPSSKWKDTPPPASEIRHMDCVDCHNRPSHQYQAPNHLINDALATGKLDVGIPKIKEKAMEILSKEYASEKEAAASIANDLNAYYQKEYADYFSANKAKISQTGETLQYLFSQNMFPDMKTRWDTHPDHIGHLNSPGCFRCHDDLHKSTDGKVITRDCNSCHKIVEQGHPGAMENNITGLEFKHPDGSEDWKDADCVDCHNGGA